MKKKKVLAIGVILFLIVIAAICVIAVKLKKAQLAKAEPIGNKPIPLSVAELKKGDFSIYKHYVGVITPLNSSNISSRITAEVVDIKVTEGNRVKKGDTLILLDDRALRQSINVLKAKAESIKTQILANQVKIDSLKISVAYWQKQCDRDKKLYENKIVSAKTYELSSEKLNEIEGEYNIALQQNNTYKATLSSVLEDIKIAETNLSYAVITAPFDGIICNVPVDPGDLAIPGKSLVEIENQKPLKVTVQIPQVDMKYIQLEKTLLVSSDSENDSKVISAPVTKIYPAIGSNRMMKIQGVLPEESSSELVSGQYVKVKIAATTFKDVIIAPAEAVNIDNNSDNGKNIFIVRGGVLKKVPVNLLGYNEVYAAISGTVEPGDKVVVSAFLGWAKLADGLKAEILK
jgi:RND family efflux transporter MFP subunit